MALSILDGNQSATTLSTIVTGGQHIPAHTVVSLGSQAITDMRSAVSGSVVSISNFPASQTIAGTVTANVTNSVTIGSIIGPTGGNCLRSISPTGDAVRVVLAVKDASNQVSEIQSSQSGTFNIPIYGSVTVGNSVTIGGISNVDVIPSVVTGVYLGPIQNGSSAVTVNTTAFDSGTSGDHVNFKFVYWATGSIPSGTNTLQASSDNSTWVNVTTGFDITTQSEQTIVLDNLSLYTVKNYLFPRTAARRYWRVRTGPQPSGGQDSYARFSVFNTRPDYQFIDAGLLLTGETLGYYALSTAIANPVTVGNSVTIGSLPAISGTVTANNPSGALTTRFGSVTTASVAQLTGAVTNSSRKYLLVQNIATSTVTIGIGFAPTTTQGIQLTAGAGLTFDAFCPTGGVWWLSATTGSNFSILEG